MAHLDERQTEAIRLFRSLFNPITGNYEPTYTKAAVRSVWVNSSSLEFLASAIEGTAAMTASPPQSEHCRDDFNWIHTHRRTWKLQLRTSFSFSPTADVHEFRTDEDDHSGCREDLLPHRVPAAQRRDWGHSGAFQSPPGFARSKDSTTSGSGHHHPARHPIFERELANLVLEAADLDFGRGGLAVGGFQFGQVALDALLNLFQPLGDLGLREIPVPRVDRFELAANA
jgi:hypothetical protein